MDDIDRAQHQEELQRAILLKNASVGPSLPATGECHNCRASVAPGARFCDADCRDDWENEQAARQRAGWRA